MTVEHRNSTRSRL